MSDSSQNGNPPGSDPNAALMEQFGLASSESTPTTPTESTPVQPTTPPVGAAEPPLSSDEISKLGETVLKNVDPRDRAVIERYWKSIQGPIGQKFQEIHGSYKDQIKRYEPYKDYDDEYLNKAFEVFSLLNNSPDQLYQWLGEALRANGNLPETQQQFTPQPQQTQQTEQPDYSDVPESLRPFIEKFPIFEQTLQSIAQLLVQQNVQSEEASKEQALDDHLKELHTKHGDFNERWVLSAMLEPGMDGDRAVKAYQSFIQETINKNRPAPPPPSLRAGGAVQQPGNLTDLHNAPSRDVVSAVAAMLEGNRQS